MLVSEDLLNELSRVKPFSRCGKKDVGETAKQMCHRRTQRKASDLGWWRVTPVTHGCYAFVVALVSAHLQAQHVIHQKVICLWVCKVTRFFA